MKRNLFFKGCAFCVATFLSFAQYCKAQRIIHPINFNTLGEVYNNLFRRAHWEIIVTPDMNSRARLTHLPNARYRLGSSPQIGYEFGFQRVTHFQKEFSLAIGVRLGLIGRNAEFVVPYSEVGYSYPGNYVFTGVMTHERDVNYFSIPTQLEYRIFSTAKRMYLLNAGVSLRFAPLNGIGYSIDNILEIDLFGNKKPFANVNVGAGCGFLLKNLDIFKVALNFNFDPAYVVDGHFTFKTNSSYDAGPYIVKGTSLGLSIIYARTNVRKYNVRQTNRFR